MQDTTVLESNGGKSSLWTRSFATSREIGTNDKAKLEGCSLDRKAMLTREEEIWCLRFWYFVYLKVLPMRGVKRFHTKGKLSPRCVGPFKIINRRGEVAYQLELLEQLLGVHDVFHVLQLKKCLRVPEEQLRLEELDI